MSARTSRPTSPQRLQPRALQVEDTDWFLDRLYAFVTDLGASLIVPRHSRYVIDLNRPSDNRPMYAGANNTELCPTRFFTGDALYRDGQAPTTAEVQQRVATYWQPYHDALRDELARLKAEHGHAILFDGHSIKSELPWLFDGKLPDLNLGTASGSCLCAVAARGAGVAAAGAARSSPWPSTGASRAATSRATTASPHRACTRCSWRSAGAPTCARRAPFEWDAAHAARVQPLLQQMVRTMLDWRPE